MSEGHRYRGALRLTLAVLLIACAAQHNQSFAQTVVTADTATFATVLRALVSDTSYPVRPIVADPRPLVGDDAVRSLQASAFASVTEAELLARQAVMQRLGVESGDASFPPKCGGVMVPTEKSSDPLFSGCPSTSRVVVAIGRPRAGERTKHASSANSRRRTLRVIIATIGPDGVSADIRDCILERNGSVWKVVRWKQLGYVE